MRIEDGGKEQQYQGGIDDIREGVVEPVIEQQDNETERDGGSYPDNLHSRTRTKTENIIVEKWGRGRSLGGRAYLPNIFPEGVELDEIQ